MGKRELSSRTDPRVAFLPILTASSEYHQQSASPFSPAHHPSMRRGDLIATYNTFDNEKRPLLSLPQSGNGGLTPSPAAGAAGTRTSSNPPPTKRQRRFSEISQQRSPPPPPPPYYEDRPFVSLESDKPRNWKRAILTTLTFASG